ncbi:hypothetical protein ONZ45_g11407 [Pleurotus djamor]|nr:hypothetical protein ONZ45_g11407 [Pleurotus djamor]
MSTHQRACAWKHRQLQENISSLPPSFSFPLSQQDRSIHELSIPQLVQKSTSNQLSLGDILTAYAKKSLIAHERTNCLSHIRFQGALLDHQQVPPTATDQAKAFRERPLLGVPVSVKDTIDVEGCDSTIACSRNLNKPAPSSSAIVQLLQDAGALVHCKTTVPPLLFALETTSDVFGTTRNPVNPAFSCGASSGGGAALLGGRGDEDRCRE